MIPQGRNASRRCSHCGGFSTGQNQAEVLTAAGTWHHRLLNTNEPPDDSEVTLIHSVVSDVEEHLARLDDEIAKIQETLNQLERKRSSLSIYRARNKAILSPLRRMPPEVLGEIFSRTLPSITEMWREQACQEYMANNPWVLSHTCSQWRGISLSTPQLWSLVVVNYDQKTCCSIPPIAAQLQRAEKLKIHFFGSGTVDSRPQIQMFQLLLQHASRWEELSLGLTPALLPLFSALPDQLFHLKRSWIVWEGPESQTPVDLLACFDSAHSLVDFGVSDEHCIFPISFPIHRLVRLQLDGPWERQQRVLKLGQNLVEAHIWVDFADSPWPEIGEVIDLPYLQRLHVSDLRVLDYLRASALSGLSLNQRTSDDDIPHIPRHLESFLDRSTCTLRRIHIRGSPAPHKISAILGKFESITELALTIEASDAQEETDLLMSALAVSQAAGSTVVAPQLRFLALGCLDDDGIDFKMYSEHLKLRWEAEECALNSAALVTGGHGPDLATLEDLRALRQEGLELLMVEGVEAKREMNGWCYGTTWFY
ncbi:hypothetical protein DFH08DRAFT_314625 [Mycena albidolilacea]|uniref:F-box domain-containing protein n=1 Tax=Mycena albidolilacea TaxID=1033008 RepID=A0AAD6ZNU1_9AGAR|nr:hypothetical protein DFH08DRAFT_314625 [Mycena albidolilacea]